MRRSPAEKALDELYAQVPTMLDCKGLCHRSCGPAPCSTTERKRIERRAGKPLDVTHDLTCTMLTNVGRCSVYGDRPMICRLWGATEEMPCPFGCRPARMLTRDESRELLARSVEVGR
jgi:hypothetical protein